MRSLILHSNSTAQWHALLGEAQQNCAINLKEDLESYLVFLLMRFTDDPSVAASILGLEFLESYNRRFKNGHALKDVGDKCLLYAGLFPARAIKRRVTLSYFVKLGQTAYSTLSNHSAHDETLFEKLCVEFTTMMDVLHAMRENSTQALDLLSSLELWHETGSLYAKRRVEAITGNVIPVFSEFKKSKH